MIARNNNSSNKSNAKRLANQVRAERIIKLPLDYIPNAEFEEPDAAKSILTPMPQPEHTPRTPRCPDGLPAYLASMYEVPLLTRQQEQHLFRKYNFLKYCAAKLRGELDLARPPVRPMNKIERLYSEAVETKNQIIQSNLRLVVSIAKRYVTLQHDFYELVSDGNQSMIHAIDRFDYAYGTKFSTYATWAIKNNFARAYATRLQYVERFRTSQYEVLAETDDYRSDPHEQEAVHSHAKAAIAKVLKQLDARERQIVEMRFGLEKGQEPHTLKQVGNELGVSKERTRQIESRAMTKLRKAASAQRIDMLVF